MLLRTVCCFLLLLPVLASDPKLDKVPLNAELLNTFKRVLIELSRIPVYLLDLLNLSTWFKTPDLKIKERPDYDYDFIIVGSGPAGSVIANRLSEIPTWRVLLLEAGEVEGPMQSFPGTAPIFQRTTYDWNYKMEYEKTSGLGFENSRMPWPRGKALGGTSTINYMIYTRGNYYDFLRWQSQGNPGWSYEDVLPYYLKSEGSTLSGGINENYHNTKGPLGVDYPYRTPILSYFFRASAELGYPQIDYNAPGPLLGYSRVQANVRRGARASAARAFLFPVKHRTNLDIITSAYVTKVLIDPNTKQAYGVNFEKLGKKFTVRANKEVILSAGSFNSPQLLMLSGVGPREHLEEMNIPVLQNLDVGKNLQDHICFPGVSFLVNKDIGIDAGKIVNPASMVEFILNGTGPLGSLAGVEGLGYIKTEVAQYEIDYPDIELIFVSGSLKSDYGAITRAGFLIRDDVYYPLFLNLGKTPDWTIFPMLLHPKSVGYMKLQSTNPYDNPLLYGNFLSDPEKIDVKTFIAAIRHMQKLSNTRAFQEIGSRLNPNPTPGCQHYEFDSDEYWECSLRVLCVTLHHQVGTCKMGPPSDPGAVVNHELKVYGIGNLRVADCSVIPFGLSAHTNAPSFMVGEKAADMIKETWGVWAK